jgi:predicted AlkP superfamily phosphohydrolase/phosphomutase
MRTASRKPSTASVIKRDSLMPLEAYARERNAFRAKVLEHKKRRKVHLGEHVSLDFEDELTIRYQVQEMLRIERIFEEEGIQHELDAYNPLIPDGSNWKATMMIEYPEADERRRMLAQLKGVERRVWVQVEECERVFAIADEDLERENEEKTSSVHFLRFELSAAMRERLRRGAKVAVGVDHPQYRASAELAPDVRSALAADLN